MMSCTPVKSSPIGWDAPWRAHTSAGQLSANAFMMSEPSASSTSPRLRPVTTNSHVAGMIDIGSRPASEAAARTASKPGA